MNRLTLQGKKCVKPRLGSEKKGPAQGFEYEWRPSMPESSVPEEWMLWAYGEGWRLLVQCEICRDGQLFVGAPFVMIRDYLPAGPWKDTPSEAE